MGRFLLLRKLYLPLTLVASGGFGQYKSCSLKDCLLLNIIWLISYSFSFSPCSNTHLADLWHLSVWSPVYMCVKLCLSMAIKHKINMTSGSKLDSVQIRRGWIKKNTSWLETGSYNMYEYFTFSLWEVNPICFPKAKQTFQLKEVCVFKKQIHV